MTTTDTRAALDEALAMIDLEIWAGNPVSVSNHHGLRMGITAHVEAEVARRLAVTPSVEEAIKRYGVQAAGGADTTTAETSLRTAIAGRIAAEVAICEASWLAAAIARRIAAPSVELAIVRTVTASHDHGIAAARIGHLASGPAHAAERAKEAVIEEINLRAAIAADRERAVEFAVDQAAKPMARRMAAEIVTTDAMISYVVGGLRAVGLLRVGPGDLDAVTWTRLANAVDDERRVPADLRVTVTPDEARRLVDAYRDEVAYYSGNTARTALLRALGVEA